MKVQQFTNYFVQVAWNEKSVQPPLGAAKRSMVLAEIRAVRSEATRERRQKHVQWGKFAQQTCNRGRLSLLTFFGEAKKVSGRAAMKRKVKQLRNKYKKQLIF